MRTALYIIICIIITGASWAAEGAGDKVFLAEVLYAPGAGALPFIELYNASEDNVDLSGWRISIAAKDGPETVTLSRDKEKVVIPGYGFYLIGREKDRGAWSSSSYKPDFYCQLSMEYAKGRGGVMLLRPNGAVRDAVGWGLAPWRFFEGTPHEPVAQGHSLERKSGPTHNEVNGNSYDTGDNSTDFRERPKPQPQNINSPRERPAATTEGNAWGRIKAMYYDQ